MKLKPLFFSAGYLLLIHFIMGIRWEHIGLISLVLTAYYAHPLSRRLIVDILPFAFFGMLYDFLRILPKSWAGTIRVAGPYHLENKLFGFSFGGERIIPCDFFLTHTHPLLDLLTGLTYSLHVVVPIGFVLYALLKDREVGRRFAWTFFLANLFAFLTYVLLPVAPPWYVELYGFAPADWSIPGNAAGLIRFDHLIGIPYFQKVYAENAWVFGAIPSMHAGFPFLVVLFARKLLPRGWWLLFVFMLLVWFSAVYLRHHYIIDLLAGALYAWTAFRITRGKRWV